MKGNLASAVAGHEVSRCNLGNLETHSGNLVQAVNHWNIAASAGEYDAMHNLITLFKNGFH